jgi:lipoprotein-anchoring transpeptidase ErfK/SrfK
MATFTARKPLSRRDFLRMSGLGLVGAALPLEKMAQAAGLFSPFLEKNSTVQASLAEGQLGRVLVASMQLCDRPSTKSKPGKTVWKDLVLPITEVTVGDTSIPYNRVWYRMGADGFAHSGSIQPVRIELNEASPSLPETGQLAEVTVPYTDTHREPDQAEQTAFRLYFGTTHWAGAVVRDGAGNAWYKLLDDKIKSDYYVQAQHVRLIPAQELAPISPDVPLAGKRIEVHLGHQAVIAYEWDRPVFMSRAATGARFSNANYQTEPGRYLINRKRPSRHMAAGDRAAPNSYDLPGVPWVCYFTEDGISFHGTFWHNDFGKTRSHGCVNLPVQAAKWIYLWTLPPVPADEISVFETYGTTVDVI